MKCPECQTDNREGMKFCEECGTKMEMVCPNCSARLPPDKKFCGECGHRISSPEAAPSIDYSEPKTYTPKFMAEKILTTRSSIEGEHKLVTVFFADVANYTTMSENLNPEDVHQIMDGCFKILMDEIHKYDGTINQFTGDGVMALFGAPLAHEDHAQRACYAALAIQKSLEAYGRDIKRDFGVEFKMRVGVNSGPVVVGAIGDDLRMDYTAIGDTTNLGSRMESMADPGSTLLSGNTYRLVREYFELASLGKVSVKGKKEPQEVYELLGVSDVVTRMDASKAKGLTKFIGRRGELSALLEAFEDARQGSGQVVGIVGEAGVGKSRLLLELQQSLTKEEANLEGRCLQFGSSIPFLPILDILRSYFAIKEGDHEEMIREKIREKIMDLDENLLSGLLAYLDLLSIKVEDDSWLRLEPREKRIKSFEALRNLFIRLGEDRPLLLVVDDLHWMDKTSEEFLDYLIGWLGQSRVMLLLLYRPEYTHPWGSKSFYKKIGLDQLSKGTSAELVQSIFEAGEAAPELRDLILSRAAGNPLFMEELTRTLLENGSIEKRNRSYHLGPKASEIQVPETVQGIIAARMDRLEDNIKRTMQVASVIGRDFAYRILQVITGMQEELKSYLLNLQGLEFIYEKQLFPELEYIFKHAVTQEVAYNSLLLGRRKELHEKIGQAIETINGAKLEEFTEVLAYHYSKSDNFERAYHYLKLSGQKAIRNNSAWEALGYYKEAIGAAGKFPDEGESNRKQLEVIHLMLSPIIVLGFPEESLSILQEGERISKALGDEKSMIRFYSNMGLFHSTRGKAIEGRTYIEKAFKASEKAEDVELMAQTAPDLSLSNLTAGHYGKVIDVASRVMAFIEKSGRETDNFGGPAIVYPALLSLSGYAMGMLGEFSDGIAFCEKGLIAASKVQSPSTSGICRFYYGLTLLERGEAGPAKAFFEKGIEDFEKAKFIQPLAQSWSGLGHAYTLLGDPLKGLDYVEKGLNFHKEAGVEWHLSNHLYFQGICHFESGDLQRARYGLDEALKSSRKNHERQTEGKALIWLGRISGKTKLPGNDEAEGFIREGMTIFQALETKPGLSLGYLFLGELYARGSRRDEALEIMKRAKAMFEEMGMGLWLGRVDDLLKELGGGRM